jgi:hypothetical protein
MELNTKLKEQFEEDIGMVAKCNRERKFGKYSKTYIKLYIEWIDNKIFKLEHDKQNNCDHKFKLTGSGGGINTYKCEICDVCEDDY